MFHMGWFLGTGFGVYGWNQSVDRQCHQRCRPAAAFIDMATSLERAGFDYMMLEDSSVLPDNHRGTFEASVKKGGHVRFDPLPLIPYLTNATKHIGVDRHDLHHLLPPVHGRSPALHPRPPSPAAGSA